MCTAKQPAFESPDGPALSWKTAYKSLVVKTVDGNSVVKDGQ